MFNDAREQIERRHPELNPDSPLYRQELIDAVIKGTNFYVRNGLARNAALVRAVADMERDAFFGGSTVTQGTSRQPSTSVDSPAPLDPGGHKGFDPNCRWITPSQWSCK